MKTIVLSLGLLLSTWIDDPPRTDDGDLMVLSAEEVSGYHAELSRLLKEVEGTSRPDYVTGAIGADSPLPESDGRPHFLSVVHRSGFSWAEAHEKITDLYVILDGAGSLVLGGQMQERIALEGRDGESRAPRLVGGEPHSVKKGDWINIPAGIPHQWDLADDEAVTYMIVKVVHAVR